MGTKSGGVPRGRRMGWRQCGLLSAFCESVKKTKKLNYGMPFPVGRGRKAELEL